MKIEMVPKHFSLLLSCRLPISFHSQLLNHLRSMFTNNLQYLLQHLISLQLGYSHCDHKQLFFSLDCPYFWFIASSGIWLGIFILKCVRAFVSLLPQIASDTWAIYYTLRSLSLSLSLGSWHCCHGRQFCPVTDNYMLVQYGVLGVLLQELNFSSRGVFQCLCLRPLDCQSQQQHSHNDKG